MRHESLNRRKESIKIDYITPMRRDDERSNIICNPSGCFRDSSRLSRWWKRSRRSRNRCVWQRERRKRGCIIRRWKRKSISGVKL